MMAEAKMQAQYALQILKNAQGLIADRDGTVDCAGSSDYFAGHRAYAANVVADLADWACWRGADRRRIDSAADGVRQAVAHDPRMEHSVRSEMETETRAEALVSVSLFAFSCQDVKLRRMGQKSQTDVQENDMLVLA